TTNTTSWTDRIILSSDDILDSADTTLKDVPHTSALAVNASYTTNTIVNLPNGIGGNFHVFLATDVNNVVVERNFENNHTGRTTTPIAVTEKPSPDLIVTAVTVPPSANISQQVTVSWNVKNNGAGLAPHSWSDLVYISANGTLTGAILVASVTRSTD